VCAYAGLTGELGLDPDFLVIGKALAHPVGRERHPRRQSGWWLGPTVSLARDAAEVDRYVALSGELLGALT
jgi:hypothetical protein